MALPPQPFSSSSNTQSDPQLSESTPLMGLHLDDPLSPSKPPPGLTQIEAQIAYLMVEGLPAPRSLEQAAKDCGYRVRRVRSYLADLPAFNAYRRQLLDAPRKSEEARNLATLIQIRDDPGADRAADRTVRLKAIQVMEGTNSKAPSVTVNVNQQSNNVVAGYVIRLPASKATAIEQEWPHETGRYQCAPLSSFIVATIFAS